MMAGIVHIPAGSITVQNKDCTVLLRFCVKAYWLTAVELIYISLSLSLPIMVSISDKVNTVPRKLCAVSC